MDDYPLLTLDAYHEMTTTGCQTRRVYPQKGDDEVEDRTKKDDLSMVYHDFGLKTRKEVSKLRKIEWNSREKLKTIPPSDGEPEDLVLVRQKVLVSHVRQGSLPNCWIMCGVAAVVYCCPELIKEIVREVTVNGVDLIEVRLYKNGGQRVVVRITDLLPCRDGGGVVTGTILFGHATERQTFASYLEKGYAYSYGTYGGLDGGFTVEALVSFTGCPSRRVKIRLEGPDDDPFGTRAENIWEFIRERVNKETKHPIVASTGPNCQCKKVKKVEAAKEESSKKNKKRNQKKKKKTKKKKNKKAKKSKSNMNVDDDDDDEMVVEEVVATEEEEEELEICEHMRRYKDKGIRTDHFFIVLKCGIFNRTRLIRLYDIHGRSSFKGDYCDASPKWNDSYTRKAYGANRQHEGEFWLRFDEFLQYFDRIDYSIINSEWMKPNSKCHHRFAGKLPLTADDHHRFATYLLKVGQDNTMVHITLHQEFRRRAANFGTPFQPIAIGLFEFEESADNPFSPERPLVLTKFSGLKMTRYAAIDCLVEKKGIFLLVPYFFGHLHGPLGKPDNDHSKDLPEFALTVHTTKPVKMNHSQTDYSIIPITLFEIVSTFDRYILPRMLAENVQCFWFSDDYGDDWCGGVVVVENLSARPVRIFWKKATTTSMASTRRDLITSDVIPPGHYQVVNILYPAHSGDPTFDTGDYIDNIQCELLPSDVPASQNPELGHLSAIHSPIATARPGV